MDTDTPADALNYPEYRPGCPPGHYTVTYEQFTNDYFPEYAASLRAEAERLTHRSRSGCTLTDQCDACNDGHWD